MDQTTHNKIASFIWGIADDVLRDLFKRGKYPDVILPMCVIRRMDAVLAPRKKAVLETKETFGTRICQRGGFASCRHSWCRGPVRARNCAERHPDSAIERAGRE